MPTEAAGRKMNEEGHLAENGTVPLQKPFKFEHLKNKQNISINRIWPTDTQFVSAAKIRFTYYKCCLTQSLSQLFPVPSDEEPVPPRLTVSAPSLWYLSVIRLQCRDGTNEMGATLLSCPCLGFTCFGSSVTSREVSSMILPANFPV